MVFIGVTARVASYTEDAGAPAILFLYIMNTSVLGTEATKDLSQDLSGKGRFSHSSNTNSLSFHFFESVTPQ